MKRRWTILMTAVLVVSAGCTKDYDSSDIEKFVKETCSIKDFEVNKQPREVTSDEDTYTDYLWDVTEADGTVFHVLDDYHWGMESITNTLRTDYSDIHLINVFNQTVHENLDLEMNDRQGFVSAKLIGHFTSRSNLLNAISELETLRLNPLCPADSYYLLKFDFPYRKINDYESIAGDTGGSFNDPVAREEAENAMLYTCVDHQLACRYEFTEEETAERINKYTHQLGVQQKDGSYFWYEDLCADEFHYGVSFASLYELLRRNGFDVAGSPEEYAVHNQDGTEYQFSYSFIHELSDGKDGYYYLKNGEMIDKTASNHCHFKMNEIKDMFDIEVTEYWMVNQ